VWLRVGEGGRGVGEVWVWCGWGVGEVWARCGDMVCRRGAGARCGGGAGAVRGRCGGGVWAGCALLELLELLVLLLEPLERVLRLLALLPYLHARAHRERDQQRRWSFSARPADTEAQLGHGPSRLCERVGAWCMVLVLVLLVLMPAGGAGGVGWWCWWCGLQQQLRFAPARTRTPREAPTHLPTYPPTHLPSHTHSTHSLPLPGLGLGSPPQGGDEPNPKPRGLVARLGLLTCSYWYSPSEVTTSSGEPCSSPEMVGSAPASTRTLSVCALA
jgi:hypothetical protein